MNPTEDLKVQGEPKPETQSELCPEPGLYTSISRKEPVVGRIMAPLKGSLSLKPGNVLPYMAKRGFVNVTKVKVLDCLGGPM